MSSDSTTGAEQPFSPQEAFEELRIEIERCEGMSRDLHNLKGLSPETASWRDLRDFAFSDGTRPFDVDDGGCFTIDQLNTLLKTAREGFLLGGKLGDEGRTGMLMALFAVIDYLRRILP